MNTSKAKLASLAFDVGIACDKCRDLDRCTLHDFIRRRGQMSHRLAGHACPRWSIQFAMQGGR